MKRELRKREALFLLLSYYKNIWKQRPQVGNLSGQTNKRGSRCSEAGVHSSIGVRDNAGPARISSDDSPIRIRFV